MRRGRTAAAVFVCAAAAATAALFLVSRGKWSDALIDSGTEWLYADALAGGALLYRDVVYWFGPFTPYFQSVFFRLLGSSFSTLAFSGAAGACGVLAALHFALRQLTDRRGASLWTALAVPTLVFMPNSGGAILGMGYRIWHPAGFALVACGLASGTGSGRAMGRNVAAGVCVGLAGLCRTEWGVIALVSVLAAVWVRLRSRGGFRREALRIAGVAALAFAATLGGFAAAAGPAALLREAPVLLVGIPAETPVGSVLSVFRGWRDGIPLLLYSTALWIGAISLAGALAARGTHPAEAARWLRRLVVVLLGLLILAAVGAGSGAVVFSAAPSFCLLALGAGLVRRRGPRAAALVAFGCLGLLASHRRLFHIADAGYVAPPLLIAIVCAAGLLRVLVAGETKRLVRVRFRAALDGALAALIAISFLGRTMQYAADDRVPVPGTGGMLSALPSTAGELTTVAAAVRAETREGDGLVVIPEGGVVNFLAGRPNPMRRKISIPGYLTESNESDFIGELERARPAVIVIVKRPAGEYGRGFFGQGYGQRTRAWIEEHYARRPVRVTGAEVFVAFRGAGS
ncbi:MAG: hypothetical protein WEB59_10590 [Thermoanaerobaculia bacterium]